MDVYLHFFYEGWKATNGHESHVAGDKSTTSSPSQDCCVTGANIIEEGTNGKSYNNINYYTRPIISLVS